MPCRAAARLNNQPYQAYIYIVKPGYGWGCRQSAGGCAVQRPVPRPVPVPWTQAVWGGYAG